MTCVFKTVLQQKPLMRKTGEGPCEGDAVYLFAPSLTQHILVSRKKSTFCEKETAEVVCPKVRYASRTAPNLKANQNVYCCSYYTTASAHYHHIYPKYHNPTTTTCTTPASPSSARTPLPPLIATTATSTTTTTTTTDTSTALATTTSTTAGTLSPTTMKREIGNGGRQCL